MPTIAQVWLVLHNYGITSMPIATDWTAKQGGGGGGGGGAAQWE